MAIKKSVVNKENPPAIQFKKIKLLITIVDRGQAIKILNENKKHDVTAVSYTHLTLPTTSRV